MPDLNARRLILNAKRGFTQHRIGAGFTLIELLIVITIIGILAGLAFVSYTYAQKKTRDTQRKSDLTQFKKAMEVAKMDCLNGYYYQTSGEGETYPSYDFYELNFKIIDLGYIQQWEVADPLGGLQTSYETPYEYYGHTITNHVCPDTGGVKEFTEEGTTHFIVRAKLESGNKDSEAGKSFTRCQINPAMPGDAAIDDGYYYDCNY